MFARNVLAGAGLARLHGGVHEPVLVVQVRAAQVQQLHHAVAGLGKLRSSSTSMRPRPSSVSAMKARSALGCWHYMSMRGGGLGLGQCGNFAGINLHHVLSWPRWALSAPFWGAGPVHHAPASMPKV